jgi:protein-disulfide isomerase
MNVGVAIVGCIVAFLAGAGLMWGYQARAGNAKLAAGSANPTGSGARVWSDADSPVAIDSKDPMWGSRSAPVTIVEFSDYQCPYCGRVETAMQQVRDTYGPEKVRVVWKNEPLTQIHPNAKPAAEAAQGVFALAGADAFWKFHDTAFKNQSALSPDNYLKWAKEAGVKDLAAFKSGLDAHTWADKVDKDNAQGPTIGAGATPAFFINGVSLVGMQPFEKFKTVIDQELQKAQAKIASGTPKDKVYVALSKENKQPTPKAEPPKEDTTVYRVPIAGSARKWSQTPLVTVVEFSDFQCPYCKQAEDTLNKLHEQYGDKLGLVWKNAPLSFHPRAEPALELALEARVEQGDKGFWDAHDRLYRSQPKLEDGDLAAVAAEMGLDPKKVLASVAAHKYQKMAADELALREDLQAEGTPHFFINGRRFVGAQPLANFQKAIDRELAKADALVASGVPRAGVYDAIMKDAKAPEKKAPAAVKTN